MPSTAVLVFGTLTALAAVFILSQTGLFMRDYSVNFPGHSLSTDFGVDFFGECMKTPAIRLVMRNLMPLALVVNVLIKIESRRNSLAGDRLQVLAAYMLALGLAFPLLLTRVFNSPKPSAPAAGDRAAAHGTFNFKVEIAFAVVNIVAVAVMTALPIGSSGWVIAFNTFFGGMVVYCILPTHSTRARSAHLSARADARRDDPLLSCCPPPHPSSNLLAPPARADAERNGELSVRFTRQSNWLYGVMAGVGLFIGASSIAEYLTSVPAADLSLAGVWADVSRTAGTRSIFFDLLFAVATIAALIVLDDRRRPDGGSGLRVALLIATFVLPTTALALFMIHRDAVDDELELQKYAGDAAANAAAKKSKSN
jgi:hypothetical protein